MPPSRTDSRSRKAVKHTLTDPEDSDDELRKKSRTMTKEFAGGKGKGKGKAKQGEGAESGLEEENSSGDGEAAAKVSAKGKGKAAAPVNPSTAKGGSKTKTKAATAPKKVTTARRQKKLPKEAGHLAGGGDVAPHGVLTGAAGHGGIFRITKAIKKALEERGVTAYNLYSKKPEYPIQHGDIVYAETYDLRKVESYYEGNSAAPEQWSSVMLMVPLSEADVAGFEKLYALYGSLEKISGYADLRKKDKSKVQEWAKKAASGAPIDFSHYAKVNDKEKSIQQSCTALWEHKHPDPKFNAELALASIRSKSWDRKNLKSKGDDVDHSLDSDTFIKSLLASSYDPETHPDGWYLEGLEAEYAEAEEGEEDAGIAAGSEAMGADDSESS
ncbi:hypothetical protein BMF94_6723 [Rhodotorula taiwanensis]|uniref:Uncharacterized protein n=1 Tax=Rhodotorula taiwanensis TaxID=741276 RepID=A0A2S5B0H7_9BASI|nr:hypothetical protein BMF94_6723 [Rhodotorula taiwanensis]